MPIQFRYRVSFLEMYVLPRAGRPTITMTVGGLAKWGAPAAAKEESRLRPAWTGLLKGAAAREPGRELQPPSSLYFMPVSVQTIFTFPHAHTKLLPAAGSPLAAR